MKFKNKNVLLTGGSLGIGLELASQMLNEGANVVICARHLPALEKAKEKYPKLQIVQCDVTNINDVINLFKASLNFLGGIDVLINNAAIYRRFHVMDGYPLEKQHEEMKINFEGLVNVTNTFLDHQDTRHHCAIINLTSPAAFVPLAASPIYSASKAAVSSYTHSLRFQLKHSKVKVILVCPPAVDTRMNLNNPGVEATQLISKEKFVTLTLKALKKGKTDIYIRPIGMFKGISRVSPKLAFNMINK